MRRDGGACEAAGRTPRGRRRRSARRAARAIVAALALLAAACASESEPLKLALLGFANGEVTLQALLFTDYVPGSLSMTVDGAPVATDAAAPPRFVTDVASAPGSHHVVIATARFARAGGETTRTAVLEFTTPVPAPALVASDPAPGAADVPRSAWLRLDFVSPPAPAARATFELVCDAGDGGRVLAADVFSLAPASLVVNPRPGLPAGADCAVGWLAEGGRRRIDFRTAAAGAPIVARYDRTDSRSPAPFPDDFFTVSDATTATGLRLEVPQPVGSDDLVTVYGALLPETNRLDGFSPLAPFVIELSDAPDPASLPQTPAESLDPLASVALLDLAPGPSRGARIPFKLQARDDVTPGGLRSFTLLIFPGIPLDPGGRYGLVVTRRALAAPGRPLDPSPFFSAAVAPAAAGEPGAVARVRALAGDVLDAAETAAVLPIPREDVALALRVSVRTTAELPADLLAVREQVRAAPPPAFTITSIAPEPANSAVLAIVKGTWDAPDWRQGGVFARDASGVPRRTGSRPVPFTMAVPRTPFATPTPLTLYQHGNPGKAETEVPSAARRSLGAAGFAVAGFTDILNREVAPTGTDVQKITNQVISIFFYLLGNARLPDYWVETHAEQIAFLRGLEALDVLPLVDVGGGVLQSQPDGVPDFAAPVTYLGISEGANNGPGFLPYAPEIGAAALVAGGARLAEVLIHQQAPVFIQQIGSFYPSLTPTDIWVGVALFQHLFDRQDNHNHGRFLYRDPVPVDGSTRKASVLLIEGLNDTLVPNSATDSLAWAIGPIPHLAPVQRPVPFLQTVTAPVQANVDPETTAAFFQYVPTGVPGIPPTPGCVVLAPANASEGHYCAQGAAESLRQRTVFFQSAMGGGPPIVIDPFSE